MKIICRIPQIFLGLINYHMKGSVFKTLKNIGKFLIKWVGEAYIITLSVKIILMSQFISKTRFNVI